MKIAVSSTGKIDTSALDPRFGRAAYFMIYDMETDSYEAVDNLAITASGGAGIATAQTMADKGVGVVITGNVGPNAMSVLSTAGIKILRGSADTVKVNIESYKNGQLETIETTVPPHFGMSRGRG